MLPCAVSRFAHIISLSGGCCYCSLTKEETGAPKREVIGSRSNGIFGARVELNSGLQDPVWEAYHSPIAALGSWEVGRAGPAACFFSFGDAVGWGTFRLSLMYSGVFPASPPSQQAETLKKVTVATRIPPTVSQAEKSLSVGGTWRKFQKLIPSPGPPPSHPTLPPSAPALSMWQLMAELTLSSPSHFYFKLFHPPADIH